MISFALLGLFQALLLPGYLAARKWTRFNLVDRMLLAVPLSLLINYLLMISLACAGWYITPVMRGIALIELLLLLQGNRTAVTQTREIRGKLSIWSLSSIAVLFTLFITFVYLLHDAGHVFEEWDSVISWNRWAVNWAQQDFGTGYMGYPQAVPAAYSTLYIIAGSTNLQTMSKIIAQIIPFFGLFCLWQSGQLKPEWKREFSIAGFLFILYQANGYNGAPFIFSGYSDPFMASMGAFTLYAYLLIDKDLKSHTAPIRFDLLLLLAISVATSALIKQAGVIMTGLFCLACLASYRDRIKFSVVQWVCLIGILAVLVLHWYVYTYYFDGFGYAGNALIKSPYWLRPFTALHLFNNDIGRISIILSIIALLAHSHVRKLYCFLLIPQYLFWAVLVSYDLRTAFGFFPWLALSTASGFIVLHDNAKKHKVLWIPVLLTAAFMVFYPLNPKHSGAPNLAVGLAALGLTACVYTLWWFIKPQLDAVRTKRLTYLLSGCAVLFVAALPVMLPSQQLLAANTRLRLQSNDAGFNQHLYDILSKDQGWLITSPWQLLYNIPTFEQRYLPMSGCDITIPMQSQVKYYLFNANLCGISTLHNLESALMKKNISYTVEPLGEGCTLLTKTGAPYVKR